MKNWGSAFLPAGLLFHISRTEAIKHLLSFQQSFNFYKSVFGKHIIIIVIYDDDDDDDDADDDDDDNDDDDDENDDDDDDEMK